MKGTDLDCGIPNPKTVDLVMFCDILYTKSLKKSGGDWCWSQLAAGVLGGRLLLEGDSRREPFNGVDVRLVHDPEELAGEGG